MSQSKGQQSRGFDSEGGEKLTPQELGHLGGVARWHGREAIEPELEQKKEAARNLGKELGHRGGIARWHGREDPGSSQNDQEGSGEEEEDYDHEDTESVDNTRHGAKQQQSASQKWSSSSPDTVLIVQGDRILGQLSEQTLQEMLGKRYAVLPLNSLSAPKDITGKRAAQGYAEQGVPQKRVRIAADSPDRSRQRPSGARSGEGGGEERGRRSSTTNRDPRAMSSEEASHVAGIARWHGREAAEEEKRQMGYGELGRRRSRSRSREPSEGRQLTPQQLGHLGGTGRWYGREAVEKEKERMEQGDGDDGDQGDEDDAQREEDEEDREAESPTATKTTRNNNKGSSTRGRKRSARAMSPQEASHVAGIARWHGREAADEEKKRLGYGDLGRKRRSGSRGDSQGDGNQLSPQELGHLGAIGRWQGRDAVEEEKKKMGLDGSSAEQDSRDVAQELRPRDGETDGGNGDGADGGAEQDKNLEEEEAEPEEDGEEREDDDQQDNNQMSQQERGHLGGTARWYGREAAEREKEKMGSGQDSRKNTEDGPGSGQHATSGQGGLGQLSPQELGHLGGKARWHGRESIEGELNEKRREVKEGGRRR